MLNGHKQMTFGDMLVAKARRCWDLTAAVPDEYENDLWKQGDELIVSASLFGSQDADYHLRVYGPQAR